MELKGCIGSPNLFVIYEPPGPGERDRWCQAEGSHGRVQTGAHGVGHREIISTLPFPNLGHESRGRSSRVLFAASPSGAV